MRGIHEIRHYKPMLADKIEHEQHGYILDNQVEELKQINRMLLVLVRCGCGRFLCPIQDLQHFIAIIEEHAKLKSEKEKQPHCGDHIRDVSLPVS